MMLEPDIPSSESIFGLPKRHHDSHLHNFDWGRISLGARGKEAVEDFLEEWRENEAPHLIIVGQNGVGKTHIACGIYRAGIYYTDIVQSVFKYIPDFCDEVKNNFKSNTDVFFDIKQASLLVLDDLFGRDLSDYDIDVTLPKLLSYAYDLNMGLVVTTNYDKDQIASKLHPHEASRLFANAKVLVFKGEDQRIV